MKNLVIFSIIIFNSFSTIASSYNKIFSTNEMGGKISYIDNDDTSNTAYIGGFKGDLLVDFDDKPIIRKGAHDYAITSVASNKEKNLVVSTDALGNIKLWNGKLELIEDSIERKNGLVLSLLIEGNTIYVLYSDATLRSLNNKGELIKDVKIFDTRLRSGSLISNSKEIVIAAGERNGTFHMAKLSLKSKLISDKRSVTGKNELAVTRTKIVNHGSRAIFVNSEKKVFVLDTANGNLLFSSQYTNAESYSFYKSDIYVITRDLVSRVNFVTQNVTPVQQFEEPITNFVPVSNSSFIYITASGLTEKMEIDKGEQTNDAEAFVSAACRGDLDKLKELVSNGVDANIKNSKGQSAMSSMSYCMKENISLKKDVILFLIENEASIRSFDKHGRSLFDLIKDDSFADLKKSIEIFGAELINAVKNNDISLVSTLLKLGANVNAFDFYNKSSLLYAAEVANLDMLEVLLADPWIEINKKDKYGRDIFAYELPEASLKVIKAKQQEKIKGRQMAISGINNGNLNQLKDAVENYGFNPLVEDMKLINNSDIHISEYLLTRAVLSSNHKIVKYYIDNGGLVSFSDHHVHLIYNAQDMEMFEYYLANDANIADDRGNCKNLFWKLSIKPGSLEDLKKLVHTYQYTGGYDGCEGEPELWRIIESKDMEMFNWYVTSFQNDFEPDNTEGHALVHAVKTENFKAFNAILNLDKKELSNKTKWLIARNLKYVDGEIVGGYSFASLVYNVVGNFNISYNNRNVLADAILSGDESNIMSLLRLGATLNPVGNGDPSELLPLQAIILKKDANLLENYHDNNGQLNEYNLNNGSIRPIDYAIIHDRFEWFLSNARYLEDIKVKSDKPNAVNLGVLACRETQNIRLLKKLIKNYDVNPFDIEGTIEQAYGIGECAQAIDHQFSLMSSLYEHVKNKTLTVEKFEELHSEIYRILPGFKNGKNSSLGLISAQNMPFGFYKLIRPDSENIEEIFSGIRKNEGDGGYFKYFLKKDLHYKYSKEFVDEFYFYSDWERYQPLFLVAMNNIIDRKVEMPIGYIKLINLMSGGIRTKDLAEKYYHKLKEYGVDFVSKENIDVLYHRLIGFLTLDELKRFIRIADFNEFTSGYGNEVNSYLREIFYRISEIDNHEILHLIFDKLENSKINISMKTTGTYSNEPILGKDIFKNKYVNMGITSRYVKLLATNTNSASIAYNLKYAAEACNPKTYKNLISIFDDINKRFGYYEETLLMISAENGCMEWVKTLLENGADKKLKNANKRNAQTLARKAGHKEIYRFIRKYK
ncbi:ankyrin repeat domain-containing protein [Halobacteriovorax sp. RT-2-6]|uniref:ankyrin repeat domain-containing protein n=1 Tax=unclassified Halobacteriovorax TaxID=2639665 RepID=UPI00399B2120